MVETKQLRYSDEILENYRISIEEKLEKALAEREVLKASIIGSDSNGTEDTGAKTNTFETASDAEQKDVFQRLFTKKNIIVGGYVSALAKISNKTFGICRITGELIPRDRLDAYPGSDLCIEEQMKEDKKNRR